LVILKILYYDAGQKNIKLLLLPLFLISEILVRVSSGFRRGVKGIFAILGCYAAWIFRQLPTFRGNLSVPSSGITQHDAWYIFR